MKVKSILKSILWAVLILVFYTIGGATSQIMELDKVQTLFVQGICIWLSVLVILIYLWKTNKSFKEYGFISPVGNIHKIVLWYLPALIIEVIGLFAGFANNTMNYILMALFMTIAVGFAEEIYFRGIILKTLEVLGIKKAIIISALIFGVTHIGNVIGGADMMLTLIQISYAFIIGIVFAQLFIITKSLYPVILWHFVHDFLCYIQKEPDAKTTIMIGGLQVIILVIYSVLLWKRLPDEKISS